jgi:hypothetical protein
MMRNGISIFAIMAAALACTPFSAAQTPSPMPAPQLQIPGFDYRAETRAPARRQGNVSAGGVAWSCNVNACTTRRPWSAPTVENCRALAAEVGAISSFGRAGAMLSAAQIAQCNASPVLQQPSIRVTPPPAITHLPAPSSGPVVMATPEISFVGGAMISAGPGAGAAANTIISTPEIVFVGGASIEAAGGGTATAVINTPELTFIGR